MSSVSLRSATSFAPLLAALLAGALILGLRGAVPFPLVSDHAYFMPASWWAAETGRLANPWMQPGFDRMLNWHGFLQPWLVGTLAPSLGGGWVGVHRGVDLLAAAAIATTALAARGIGLSPWRGLAVVAIATALMLDARSRPEVSSTLETAALVWACVAFARGLPDARGPAAAIGGLAAAIVCTHPAVALFAALGLAGFLAVVVIERRPAPGALLRLASVATGGFVFVFATAGVFGLDGEVVPWLNGLSEAGRITLARTDDTGLLRYYLADRFLPGFGLFAIPLAGAAWAALSPGQGARLPAVRWLLCGVVGLAGLFLLHRFALRIPATYYNLTGCLVAVTLIAARTAPAGRRRRIVDLALAGLALAGLAGIAVWAAQAVAERPTIAPTRAELAAALAADRAAGRRVCADAAALAAVDRPDAARAIAVSLRLSEAPAAPDPAACDVYYALQAAGAGGSALAGLGFVAERTAEATSPFTRFGLRPSHFGFTRWVAETAK